MPTSASPASRRQRVRNPPMAPSPAMQQAGLQDLSDDEAEELEVHQGSPIRKSFGSAARRFFKKASGHGRSLSSDHDAAATSQPLPYMVPFTNGSRAADDSNEGNDSPPGLHYGSETTCSASMESLFSSADGRTSSLGCPVHIPERRRGRKGSLSSSPSPPMPLTNLFGLGLMEGGEHLTTPRPAPPTPAATAASATARSHGHRRVDSTSRGAPRAAMELQGTIATVGLVPEQVHSQPVAQQIAQPAQVKKATSLRYDPSRRPMFPPTPPRECVKDLPNLEDESNSTSGSPFARPKTARGRPAKAAEATINTSRPSPAQDPVQLPGSSSNLIDELAADLLEEDVLVAMTFESQQRDREILAPLNIQKKRATSSTSAASAASAKRPSRKEKPSSSASSETTMPSQRASSSSSSVARIADGEKAGAPEDAWQSGATARQWSSTLHDGSSRRRPRRTVSPAKQRKVTPPPPTCSLPALPVEDVKAARLRPLVSSPEAMVLPLPTGGAEADPREEEHGEKLVLESECYDATHLPPQLDLDLGSGGTLKFPRQPGSGSSSITLGAGRTPATATTRVQQHQQLETMLDGDEEPSTSSRAATPAGSSGPTTPASGASTATTQWAHWPSLRRPRPTPTSLPTSVLPYEVEHRVSTIVVNSVLSVAASSRADEIEVEDQRDQRQSLEQEQEDKPSLARAKKRGSPPNLAWHLDALRLDLDDVDLLLGCGDSSPRSSSPPSATPSSISAGGVSTDGSAYSLPSIRGESFEYELADSTLSSRVVSMRGAKEASQDGGQEAVAAVNRSKRRPASSLYGGVDLDGEDIAAAVSALMA